RTQFYDVHLCPIFEDGTRKRIGVTIQFNDLTDLYQLRDERLSVNHQLHMANEELQSAHEELETTNEELQSTNEERETTKQEVHGQSIFDLDIGLPVSLLKAPLRTFFRLKKDFEEVELDAVNRRGRKVHCSIRITSLADANQSGVVLLIDDYPPEGGMPKS